MFWRNSVSHEPSAEEVDGVNQAIEDRLHEFKANCDNGKGDPMACHSWGEWLTVVEKDYNSAAEVYRKNCEQNCYAASCFNLGRLTLAGKGIEENDEKALELFESSCAKKHAQACQHAALMYLEGIGTSKDVLRGLAGLKTACKQDDAGSCSRVGSFYLDPPKIENKEQSKKLQRDPIRAKKYYGRACDANFAPACYNLAVMFKNGDTGVDKNEELYEEYKKKTEQLVNQAKGMLGVKTS
uniref:Hcp betalactamaselike protein putative n=1 Tax=Albugo laibachii Nc14 TaxID=890382 RepID=F0WJI5_9STRA|nr:hcp betalactamaselike protein putative [Albugo laibachii Nc14]|eukprot:CCA21434.1 hcp betalactamaselike protein putative [Albugo laibachii Nc14]